MEIITKADLEHSDSEYNYSPYLTPELDRYDGDYDDVLINKITLWKVNRVPVIPNELLSRINNIQKADTSFDRQEIKELLVDLLGCHGVQIPMASTYLRFKNPSLFQIIDQRVFRVLYGREIDIPLNSKKNRDEIAEIYLQYLEELRDKCIELGINFELSDRILYNADKRINKKKNLKNYGSEPPLTPSMGKS